MQPIEHKWYSLATLPIPQLEQEILGKGNVFEPANWLIEAAFGKQRRMPLKILDFGAGLLRNTVGLLTTSSKWQVTAYDLPQMLIKGKMLYSNLMPVIGPRLILAEEWDEIKIHQYDAILATLVLQHMSVASVREALTDFAAISDTLVVCGRDTFDEQSDLTVDSVIKEQWSWVEGWGSEGTTEHHTWAKYHKK